MSAEHAVSCMAKTHIQLVDFQHIFSPDVDSFIFFYFRQGKVPVKSNHVFCLSGAITAWERIIRNYAAVNTNCQHGIITADLIVWYGQLHFKN